MSQENALPRRVLVVDDDASMREAVADLLRTADLEVATAADGTQALTLLGRRWFPVVVTDRALPAFDGIEFTSRLRSISMAPVYVIMLTVGSDAQDYERGYCAGVDHYLTKQSYEKELLTKVLSGLTAIRRRQSAVTSRGDAPVTVDLENGAHTARHLVGRLCAEIAQAARAQHSLHVLSISIEIAPNAALRGETIGSAASASLLQAVYGAARPGLDWVARLPASRDACRLAVIMPESTANDVAAVEQGMRNAFVRWSEQPALRGLKISVGAAKYATGEKPITALELLGESERNRRGVAALGDIKNIQGSAEMPVTNEAA